MIRGRRSIRRDLASVSALSSTLALVLTCAAFLVYDIVTFRRGLLADVASDARVVAFTAVAPLLFDDPEAASTSLAALKGKPRIRSAVLTNAKGALVASYGAGGRTLPAGASADPNHRFDDGRLILSVPVLSENTVIGTLTLEAGLEEIAVRIRRYLILAFCVLVVALLASLAISGGLQRRVLQPVTRLTEAARKVSREKDYSVRVAADQRDDELGLLTITFNTMLGTIEEQNAQLKRESEQRLRLLVDNVKDYALTMLDPDGIILTWNKGAEQITQYDAPDAVGRDSALLYPPEDRAAGRPGMLLERARREGRVEDEGLRVRKDGSRFWAEVVITAATDSEGKVRGFSEVIRDLTERLKAENERLRLVKAQEAVGLRDEFLSIAAHELKTPLTALQLQLQSTRPIVDGPVLDRIERAILSTQRLATLIESLLDVSRIATGRLSLKVEDAELRSIAQEVIDRLQPSAEHAGTTIHLCEGEPVAGRWDRLRLGQVLTNLVANGIKYGKKTPVEVSIGRDGGTALIAVMDRGPGIAEADMERIFGRFERAASMRHFGGLGLGLYIVRQIVLAHGGDVIARNLPSGGACFTVRLPVHALSSETASEVSSGSP